MKTFFIAVPQITSGKTIEAMRALARAFEITPIFAMDVQPQLPKTCSDEITKVKFLAICNAMRDCDGIIANFTPFVGVEPDPDVVFQWGYMAALDKPTFAYTNDRRSFYQRLSTWNQEDFKKEGFVLRDRDDMQIENMGVKDHTCEIDHPGPDQYHNLMLEGPSTRTNSPVFTPYEHEERDKLKEVGARYSFTDVFDRVLMYIHQHPSMVLNPIKNPEHEAINGVYLAGPGVFLPNVAEYFDALKALVGEVGLKGVAPIDAGTDFTVMQRWAMKNGNNPGMRHNIYEENTGIIRSVRIGLFNLTPYQGAFSDSGTVFEMGYMVGKEHALGREPMVYGFSTSAKSMSERVQIWRDTHHGSYDATAALNMYVNSEATGIYSDMIDGAILASSGSLAHRPSVQLERQRKLCKSQKYACLDEASNCIAEMGQCYQSQLSSVLTEHSLFPEQLLGGPVSTRGLVADF